jgi:hypothetical protein
MCTLKTSVSFFFLLLSLELTVPNSEGIQHGCGHYVSVRRFRQLALPASLTIPPSNAPPTRMTVAANTASGPTDMPRTAPTVPTAPACVPFPNPRFSPSSYPPFSSSAQTLKRSSSQGYPSTADPAPTGGRRTTPTVARINHRHTHSTTSIY